MELFNFDVCPSLKSYAILSVVREKEFSPLKNHTGKDSADSCKSDLSNYNLEILKNLDCIVKGEGICEISPLFDLETVKGKSIELPSYFK